MELKEDIVDIIVPFFRTPEGEQKLETFINSLKEVDPGFPYNLIIAEGQKPCIQNRNDGLRKSTSRYILMVDDDVIFIQPNWLKEAIDFMKNTENIGGLGFRVKRPNTNVYHTGRILITRKDESGHPISMSIDTQDFMPKEDLFTKRFKVSQVAGCCFLFDKLVAGYFAEGIYPDSINSEDADYMMAIQANGWDLYYLGDIEVIHDDISPQDKIKKYNLKPDQVRNHQVFYQRWGVRYGKIKGEQNGTA